MTCADCCESQLYPDGEWGPGNGGCQACMAEREEAKRLAPPLGYKNEFRPICDLSDEELAEEKDKCRTGK